MKKPSWVLAQPYAKESRPGPPEGSPRRPGFASPDCLSGRSRTRLQARASYLPGGTFRSGTPAAPGGKAPRHSHLAGCGRFRPPRVSRVSPCVCGTRGGQARRLTGLRRPAGPSGRALSAPTPAVPPSPRLPHVAAATGSPLSHPPLPAARCVRTQGAVKAPARRFNPRNARRAGPPLPSTSFCDAQPRAPPAPRPAAPESPAQG